MTTEELLNRVVLYKVAHHLSHNGTARSLGLEMMIHPDLTAMATLDYDYISKSWKNTMPNRAIIKELLKRTRGRTLIVNTEGLHWDKSGATLLETKIDEYRNSMSASQRKAFDNAVVTKSNYIQYTLKL